jgi:hypothetical protein
VRTATRVAGESAPRSPLACVVARAIGAAGRSIRSACYMILIGGAMLAVVVLVIASTPR